MTEELKKQIIDLVISLSERIGERVIVDDWIATRGRNYDRHHTSYGRVVLNIEEFHVRMSGSIATMGNEEQRIEFRTDAIQYIETSTRDVVIEINLTADVWRRIKISKIESPVDNRQTEHKNQ